MTKQLSIDQLYPLCVSASRFSNQSLFDMLHHLDGFPELLLPSGRRSLRHLTFCWSEWGGGSQCIMGSRPYWFTVHLLICPGQRDLIAEHKTHAEVSSIRTWRLFPSLLVPLLSHRLINNWLWSKEEMAGDETQAQGLSSNSPVEAKPCACALGKWGPRVHKCRTIYLLKKI